MKSAVYMFIFSQKFEAYDSNGTVLAGDKNKEVGPRRTLHSQKLSQCEKDSYFDSCRHLFRKT